MSIERKRQIERNDVEIEAQKANEKRTKTDADDVSAAHSLIKEGNERLMKAMKMKFGNKDETLKAQALISEGENRLSKVIGHHGSD